MNLGEYKARKDHKRESINYNPQWSAARTTLRCVENPQAGLRLVGFADEIAAKEGFRRSIDHTGWFTNEFQDSTYRGVVYRLPHGVLIAGYVSSDDMATSKTSRGWINHHCAQLSFAETYSDELEAARAADRIAELLAEKEREYQEAWQAGNRFSELANEAKEAWQALRALARERGAVKRQGLQGFPAICAAITANAKRYFADLKAARKERSELESNFSRSEAFKDGAGL